MRILFVTRKFPPSTGGMETLSTAIWQALSGAVPDSTLVAYGGPNAGLPRWLPGALGRVRGELTAGVDHLVVGDALLTALLQPVLASLSARRRPRVTSLVMGLDLTWARPGYRPVVRRALARSDAIVAISAATAQTARHLGLPAERVHVLPLGIDIAAVPVTDRRIARVALQQAYAPGGRLLATVGRLVERKGVAWFVRTVLPSLGSDVHYLVAGAGPQESVIRAAAAAAGVSERVHLLGLIDEPLRDRLLAGADAFVQPNLLVPGDMEGFGLVVVEAAGRGTPVLAADLEGLADAVSDGVTGTLVTPADATAWTAATRALLALSPQERDRLGAKRGAASRDRYSLARMSTRLLEILDG